MTSIALTRAAGRAVATPFAAMGRRAARALRLAALGLAGAALAACDGGALGGLGGLAAPAGGPSVDTTQPVRVALLVPGGTGTDGLLSRNLENAARLALAQSGASRVDLAVYSTGGTGAGGQAAATAAIAEGARIILGPLFAEAANAAGVVAGQSGINVVAFSNNSAIAGGNVFVLGNTFENTARRLLSYGASQGRGEVLVVAENTAAGQAGAAAVATAARQTRANLVGTISYEFSQAGVVAAIPDIAAAAQERGADTVFITTDPAGALPLLLDRLPGAGVQPPAQQFVGLTRWDIPATTLSLPGAQGAWFARPDADASAAFDAAYAAAYGSRPHPLAPLAYDGVRMIDALLATGRSDALTGRSLTRGQGFSGATGAFRLRADGTNDRALAVAAIQGNQAVIVDRAPSSFGRAGF